ncbi:MAG: transposase [Pirellulaceae bacterium]
MPKLRQGTYYPDWLLEPRRPAEKALVNVIEQAYIAGVSTRKMEKVVGELGLNGLDKSKVSRMTKALNDEVEAFQNRPLDKRCAYVWLDALYPKVRQNHRIVSQAFVIALGVDETGHRTILGFQVGAAESEAFWVEFLRSLVIRKATTGRNARVAQEARYGPAAPRRSRSLHVDSGPAGARKHAPLAGKTLGNSKGNGSAADSRTPATRVLRDRKSLVTYPD